MLQELLPAQIFAILLVFVRLGTTMLLMPGIGDPYVPPRTRLILALLIALVIAPILGNTLPAMPESAADLVVLIVGEFLIGAFFGTITRLYISALTTAGMIIAFMSSMANALTPDPSAAQQGSIAGSFLVVAAVLTIFTLDLHHAMLAAVIDSYQLFVPGQVPPVADFADMISRVVAQTFLLSFQISAPFIAVGLIFFLGLGLLGRLMPQMQVFFVAMPLQIAAGLVVLVLVLPAILRWFVGAFQDSLLPFVAL
ncbi:MAG TPA: flagellar biosynthetic protein FliR [Kiloniellales bacterium]|jgi:flagellar biosynthetic protein FliR